MRSKFCLDQYEKVLALPAHLKHGWIKMFSQNKFKHILWLTSILFIFSCYSLSFAHSPHDVIVSIELSPSFSNDEIMFLIVSNTLQVSRDGGYAWKKLANGLDYVNQLTCVSLSPAFDVDKTVFVSSQGDGIYRSQDSGNSWQKVNTGLDNLDINHLAIFQYYKKNLTVLAADAGGRLYRTHNDGEHWQTVFTHQTEITSISHFPSTKKGYILIGTKDGMIYRSVDGGDNWDEIAEQSRCGAITSIAISPDFSEDQTIWLGSEHCGVLKSDNGGRSFLEVNSGLPEKNIASLFASAVPGKGVTLYASTWNEALFRSDNGGNQWIKYGNGLTTDPQAKDPLFWSPNFKGIAVSGDIFFLGGFDGLFKSTNGGREWIQLDTILPSGITGLAVSPMGDQGEQYVALVTYGGGAYLFENSNKTWAVLNKGLQWPRLNDIAFSPAYKKDGIIFSGSENNFLIFSNRGKGWQRIPVKFSLKRRIKRRLDHYLKKVGISAEARHSLFKPLHTDTRFPTFIAPSPAYSQDPTLFFGTRSSGIYRSLDGGQTSSMTWDAKEKLVTALEISPNFPDDKTVLAGLYGLGVFKTEDGGRSWKECNNGLLATRQVLLEFSPDYSNDKTVIAGTDKGLFITSDGGAKWRKVGKAELGHTPNVVCLAVSPCFKRDGFILVGIKGKGLWASEDKGATFSPIGTDLIENNYQAKFVEFSPNYSTDSTIYFASSYAFFRSMNKGGTWEMISRPVRYEDMREEIRYRGTWEVIKDEKYSALTMTRSQTAGSLAELRFVGTRLTWMGNKSPEHGEAKVYIDGKYMGTASQYDSSAQSGAPIFTVEGLEPGGHQIVIEVICQDGNDECGWVSIDALDVMPIEETVLRRP